MKTHTINKEAKIIGIHPNTIRLYEELQLVLMPK